jgi:FKBP-type peptidyl-prolyl cis-trans isomerase
VLALVVVDRAGAQMSADAWSTDATLTPLNPGQTAHAKGGPDFPLPTYSAIGSSLAWTGHFAELGWNEAQVAAFLDGMRATFQGKPFPLDEKARQLLSNLGQETTAPGLVDLNSGLATRVKAGPDFPLASCRAVGSSLAWTGHFAELGWNEAQIAAFLDGMRAVFQGKLFPFDEKAQKLLSDIRRQIGDIEQNRKLAAPKSLDRAGWLEWYMKKVRDRLGLQQSDSGLAYRVESGRGGIRPRPGDTLVFACTATAEDGRTKLPQMSGERVRMKMVKLLPGLMEGLQMMTIDSSAIFALPPSLSFGQNPWPDGVQPGSTIFFTITLHNVIAAKTSPLPTLDQESHVPAIELP